MDRKAVAHLLAVLAKLFLRTAVLMLNTAHRLLTAGAKLANLDSKSAEQFSADLIAYYLNTRARPCMVLAERESRVSPHMYT